MTHECARDSMVKFCSVMIPLSNQLNRGAIKPKPISIHIIEMAKIVVVVAITIGDVITPQSVIYPNRYEHIGIVATTQLSDTKMAPTRYHKNLALYIFLYFRKMLRSIITVGAPHISMPKTAITESRKPASYIIAGLKITIIRAVIERTFNDSYDRPVRYVICNIVNIIEALMTLRGMPTTAAYPHIRRIIITERTRCPW